MKYPAKVQIVIPVHNRRETTRLCLLHLMTLGVTAWAEVIVVNDGSTDGTAEMISTEHPWVQVLNGDGTLWWTGAIVTGMHSAIQQGADFIVWLNDDTLPDAGTMELLVAEAHAGQAICGAVCRGDDGRAIVYGGGTMPNQWPQPVRKIHGLTPLSVQWLHGNLVAIPESVWRRCGLPDASPLLHNLADISYTYGAHQVGVPVKLLPLASALAAINDSASYWSWLDPRVNAARLITGLWDKKMWWYAPGVFYFQWHHFRWRALPTLGHHFLKLVLLLPLKILIPRCWMQRLNRQHPPR